MFDFTDCRTFVESTQRDRRDVRTEPSTFRAHISLEF